MEGVKSSQDRCGRAQVTAMMTTEVMTVRVKHKVSRIVVGTALVSAVGAGLALTAGTAVASPPTGDRPVGVAEVKASQVVLNSDGTVTVTQRVRCDPAWAPAELDVSVSQSSTGAGASGYTIPDVPCDNKWHPVTYVVSGSGGLVPGKVGVSSQFLVTNLASGDSAGGHDSRTLQLKLAG
jgi:hypothetical protein